MDSLERGMWGCWNRKELYLWFGSNKINFLSESTCEYFMGACLALAIRQLSACLSWMFGHWRWHHGVPSLCFNVTRACPKHQIWIIINWTSSSLELSSPTNIFFFNFHSCDYVTMMWLLLWWSINLNLYMTSSHFEFNVRFMYVY